MMKWQVSGTQVHLKVLLEHCDCHCDAGLKLYHSEVTSVYLEEVLQHFSFFWTAATLWQPPCGMFAKPLRTHI